MKKILLKLKRELIALLAKIRLRKFSSDYFGLKLQVPVVYGVVNGGYVIPAETWMSDCIRSFIATKKGCVIDIGVNVGLYLVKLRAISNDTVYYGFEPNPSCNLYTQELIRLNKFKSARVFPLALSDGEGVASFYVSGIGDKTGSLIKEHKKGENLDYSFDVYTTQGDNIIRRLDIDAISVIKIDVEEAEIYVLRGLEDTIKKYRPYIYCEILYSGKDSEKMSKTREICDLVAGHDYSILGITKDHGDLRIVEDPNDVGVNYLQEYIFCPNEMVSTFRESIKNNSSGIAVN